MSSMETARAQRMAELTPLFLRSGLGAVFLSFGIWKAMSPVDWILFVPAGWLRLSRVSRLSTLWAP